MNSIRIPTKAIGLKKSEVNAYIAELVKSHKSKLNELLQEKKILERTKYKLLLEIDDMKEGETVYEDVYETPEFNPDEEAVAAADANVHKTITLINELADQKIESMINRANAQIADYDAVLESLQNEIDTNKEKIEQLLMEVINYLKTNIDEVFSESTKKPDKKAPNREKVVSFADKKISGPKTNLTVVPKDIETNIITSLKSYSDMKTDFNDHISAVLSKEGAKGAVLLVEINNLFIANYFTQTSQEDVVMSGVIKKINELPYNLYTERLSYDQIGIIYDGVSDIVAVSELATVVLEQIQTDIGQDGRRKAELSANIGIALYPHNAQDSKTIMNCAGIALYKSKEKGKGCYEFINEELIYEIKLSNDFRHDIIKAMEKDELELFYQPLFSASDNTLSGFEALLRWRNEKYDRIPIVQIIKTAEKEGLISDVGAYIFKKACLFANRIKEKSGRRIIVSVNFSNSQIEKKDFLDTIKEIINETGADPHYIGFEVTESCFTDCFSENCLKMQQLKDMGITIMIDDFGTGYSTLSYLLRLPVSVVKIDKTFLDDIITSERNANFIRSIISITHDLGLKIVAEGVENEKQRAMLKEMSCDYFQGYYLSRPVSERETFAYL
ncbi:MAG: Phytochrome-like protein cph2 [Firmicutes bacterium ADurb.Bin193]|nr:MAG: Phytochrome-like protein cph2 [Firmicutes bacterium ADurb.Bin193]